MHLELETLLDFCYCRMSFCEEEPCGEERVDRSVFHSFSLWFAGIRYFLIMLLFF